MAILAESPNIALLAWLIGSIIALLGALTFAELGGIYHGNGAQYAVLRDSYGPLTAFIFVFCNATAIQAGAAAIIAIICAQYLGTAIVGHAPTGYPLVAMSAALIAGLMLANIIGVKWGSRIQNFTVYAKVLTLLAVTAAAVLLAPEQAAPTAAQVVPDVAEPAATESTAGFGLVGIIFAALVPAFFAFGGWQHALWISGEVRNPRRNVPRSIVGGVVIVSVVYMLANWAYLRLLGYEGVTQSTALASDAVGAVWPGRGPRIVAMAVAISAFGVLNAQLLSGPRLLYGMAQDGRFFSTFGRMSKRFGTPLSAIVLIGTMALVLLFIAGMDGVGMLLTGVVFIDGIFFVLTGAALIVLRRKRADADRPVRVPLYPLVPLLFVLGELGIVIGAYLDPTVRKAAFVGAVWIVVAAILYLVAFRRKGNIVRKNA